MASPQVENGFTRIANELLETICKTNMNAYQHRVFNAVLRKTYGWNRKQDRIPISQIVELTGLKKFHVSRAKAELIVRNMVTQRGNYLAINKDWSQWRKLPNGVTPYRVTQRGELKRKEKKSKAQLSNRVTNELPEWLDVSLWEDFKKHRKTIKAPMTDLAEKKLLIRLEKLMRDTGSSQQDIIDQSIMNGWKGLFEVKEHGRRKDRPEWA